MIDLAQIPWLPRPPANFRERCDAAGDVAALRSLAGHALDGAQLVRLDKALARAGGAGGGVLPGLARFRLGVISNGTTKLVAPLLRASALRHGLALDVVEAEFDQAVQEAVSPDSTIVAARPDAVLLALDHRAYAGLAGGAAGDDGPAAYLAFLMDGLGRQLSASLIVQSVACPPEALFGGLEARVESSLRSGIHRLNRAIACTGGLLLDVAALADAVGTHRWFDPVQWHMAKLPFSQALAPLYAEHVTRLLGALRGRSRKCLVLDLDNTLWGGVIGDDGPEGITLGQGSAAGEAFLDVQRTALELRARGVVLAVSSKNEDAVARAVFRDHPDMLLREEHVAVFQANWNDKATNLEAIARALNIGLDALVLLDDNPAERAQVRGALPEVAVPEVGDDPALYRRLLLAGGYFEAVTFTDDDRARAGQYQANAERAALAAGARDLGSHLRSLDMVVTFAPFDAVGRARIAQLINKSNQFNLTTRRYTELEVAAVEADPDAIGLQVRLSDAFGDNGMISVVILRRQEAMWSIDTWLMSCRVLGRRVEEAVLDELLRRLRQAGAETLVGVYKPTDRNGIVRDHYRKLGFEEGRGGPDGETRWTKDASTHVFQSLPLRVVHASAGT